MRSGLPVTLAACLFLAPVSSSHAGGTRTSTPHTAELARGELDGVAVGDDGTILLAPGVRRLDDGRLAGGPARVWSIAADRGGLVYLGTGPDGRIVRVRPSGESDLFYRTDEPMVTALAWTPGGELLAGTAPTGRIYRIDADGRGSPWCETEERYVWALLPLADGSVLAATGDRGRLLRISASGAARTLFDADEAHLRALVDGGGGAALAGGAGRGLVYRVENDGRASVLFDDEMDEVVALRRLEDGAVLAALVSAARRPPRPPALRIRLPGTTAPDPAGGTAGALDRDLDDGAGRWVHGTIEGIDGDGGSGGTPAGRLVRVDANGRVETLWESAEEAPLALGVDSRGRPLFGTGEPARIYRIDGERRVSRLAALPPAHVTGLIGLGETLLLATSNPGGLYRLDEGGDSPGVFLSAPVDAGGPARWGRLRWTPETDGGRVELYTRTGNGPRPDESWSAWSPLLARADGSAIPNPDGRFLQWRARLFGTRSGETRLRDVSVSFEPYNRAPRMRGLGIEATTAPGNPTVLVWEENDPDGDALRADVRFAAEGVEDWRTAVTTDTAARAEAVEELAGGWRRRRFHWDTSSLDEGSYRVRLELTDRGANPPDEGRSAPSAPPLRVTVDRTPPEIELTADGDGSYRIRVRDTHSPVAALTVLRDGIPQFTLRPEDGLCDSPQETFRLRWEGPGRGVALRASDLPGHVGERALEEEEMAP